MKKKYMLEEHGKAEYFACGNNMKKRVVKELKRAGVLLCMMSLLAVPALNVAATEVEEQPEYETEIEVETLELSRFSRHKVKLIL